MKYLLFTVLFLCTSYSISAQDLVYKARNPAFGGDTFNYQWLLSGAQAQDTYQNPSLTTTSAGSNSLDSFKESLNRQLLSRLSSQLITNQFGEDDLKPGSYVLGDYQVDVTNSLDGILIDIFDQATGQSTQLLIPFF